MRERAGGDEQIEVGERCGTEPAPTRLGRSRHRVDRLAGTILASFGKPFPRRLPQFGHRSLLSDQHPGTCSDGDGREGAAPLARRDDVRARVAEGDETAAFLDPAEAAEAPPGDVLEEDALDRVLRAVLEDLLQGRLDDLRHPLDLRV